MRWFMVIPFLLRVRTIDVYRKRIFRCNAKPNCKAKLAQ
jgi:hypothetical protein